MMRLWTTFGGALALAACDKAPAPAPTPTATVAPPAIPSPTLTPTPTSFLPAEFRALGTEPFWSANVMPGKLVWSSPDDAQATTIAVERRDGSAKVRLAGRLKGAALALEVMPGPCSDGMSDRVYPFTAVLTIGGEARQGCAVAKDQLEREPKP